MAKAETKSCEALGDKKGFHEYYAMSMHLQVSLRPWFKQTSKGTGNDEASTEPDTEIESRNLNARG